MQFGAHYLPTDIPALDRPEPEFYRKMFERMELLDQVGVHQVWVTEHHFHEYGGTIPRPGHLPHPVLARCDGAHHHLRDLLLRRDASGDGAEEHPQLRRRGDASFCGD
jgi:hypothetical protein